MIVFFNQRAVWMLVSMIVITGAACTKFVTVPPPTTQVTTDGAFSSDASAEATVTGLYGQIMSGNLYFLNGANTVYPALSADELTATFADGSTDAFTLNAISPDNSIAGFDLWGRAYSYLYQMNACLEGISDAAPVTQPTKDRLGGEVMFMRALTLFYLVNLYGEVPMPLSTDYTVNKALPRSDTGLVYEQIWQDLANAKEKLRRAGILTNANRPSYYACAALMARVALYRKEWAEAVAEADTVMNSNAYSLPDLQNTFLAGSSESIFSMVPVIPSLNTGEGLYFVPYDALSMPLYTLTDSMTAVFAPGDERKDAWTGSSEVNGTVYFYPFKYKVKSSNDMTENYIVLRLAELYLIRAEAKAESGNVTGAKTDVDAIRARAGLLPLPEGLSKDAMLQAVMQERRVELFCEWGHRWLDLKRTGTADAVLNYKSGWEATDALYPIPYNQILLNGNLTQNGGY